MCVHTLASKGEAALEALMAAMAAATEPGELATPG